MSFNDAILKQIQDAWSKIDGPIHFQVEGSDASALTKAVEFLQPLVGLNPLLSLEQLEVGESSMRISISRKGEKANVHFRGLPMGHELTSLVLAPLVLRGKAKMPDDTTSRRIQALQGPIEVNTCVSLSCENCPIVVQAFNTMAALNPSIQHTMVDGATAPEEMKALGVMSVPTVHVNGESFATGRQDMTGLLEKLEQGFAGAASTESLEEREYDVVVVGGGPAGASAAIYTARKGLRTAIVAENIGGQVRETKGIENQIGVPYTEGPQLAEQLRDHVQAYDIAVLENQRVEAVSIEDGTKAMNLKGGLQLKTPTIIAATGARWRELGVPGEKEYLGRGVAFCPHCDGPFYKDKEIAVVGGGNSGVEAALDLAGICAKVTLIEYRDALKADQVLLDKVEAAENIEAITMAQTLGIEGDGKKVTGLSYRDRTTEQEHTLDLTGVFVQIGLVPNSAWISDHVETTAFGEIVIDEKNHTSTAGIYAAGDVSTVPYKQIVIAMGEGAKAGLSAFDHVLKSA